MRKRRRKKPIQLELPRHGGRRKGAGRPRTKGIVLHRTRPEHQERFPLHVVLRVRRDVGSLRTDRRFAPIKRGFRYGCDRFGMRMCEFSVQDNHIHLIVEARDKDALSRGMQGLEIRLAKGINRAANRKGKVFAERYFARPLRTVAEVRNAVDYVRKNVVKHRGEDPRTVDEFSSMSGLARWWSDSVFVIAAPRSWLLRRIQC